MSEAWEVTTLGEAGRIVMGSSPPGHTYNVDGIGLPFLQGSAEFGEKYPVPVKWCSQPNKVAQAGDLLVSVRAPVGDTNFADRETAIGRGLATISSSESASAEFLRLVIQFSIADLLARSGSGMFSSITAKELRGFSFNLPPVPTQRRIVAVMDAIDKQIEAVANEVEAAERVLDALLEDALDQVDSTRPFGAIATASSGPSWSAKEETEWPVEGSLRVLKITNTRPDGSLDLSDQTYVAGLPESTRLVSDDSLIMIRTNGNRSRIGNVYRPRADAHGCAVSAFQFLVRLSDPADREYLYWTLRRPSAQLAMSEAASGSTGLGNLAVKWLKTFPVPWPEDASDRERLVAQFDALEGHCAALKSELECLRAVRSATLNALLSRELEIPESFDAAVGLGGVA